MKISKVQIDVIERDNGLLNVKDERTDIGGKTTQGVLRLFTDEGLEGNAFIGDQAMPSDQRITVIDEILRPKIRTGNLDQTFELIQGAEIEIYNKESKKNIIDWLKLIRKKHTMRNFIEKMINMIC